MANGNSFRRWALLGGVVGGPLTLVVALVALVGIVSAGSDVVSPTDGLVAPAEMLDISTSRTHAPQGVAAMHPGYVLRFDPVAQSFNTFTVSIPGANPHDIAVVSGGTNVDVWFTEPDVDAIGRLTFTSTQDYQIRQYTTLLAGSRPHNLVVDATRGFVWFTEQAGNRIGRLDFGGAGVTYGSFEIPTPDSQPAGIDLAPDGSVWFTELGVDKIAHLTVVTPSDFQFTEYPIPGFPGLPPISAPYGVFVETDDKIWFTETNRDQLVRLTPSSSAFVNTGTVVGEGYPFNLAHSASNNRLWFTELQGNNVTLFSLSTLAIGFQYPVPTPHSQPYDLVADSSGRIWFSEQLGGKLARLVVTTTGTIQEFPLPVAHAKPQGVAVDGQDNVWLAASSWNRALLPVITKNHPSPPPLFGVQTYWPVDDAHGLQQSVDAGVKWMRLQMGWVGVEPDDTLPEHFAWGKYDSWLRNLTEGGIRPVVNIQGNPGWAALYAGGPVYPDRMVDLVEFVSAAVERYDGDGVKDAPGSPVVDHWEFYNEPDNGNVLLAEQGYGYWGHNGAGYADMLRQLWPAIKAANPRAQVLNGGIAYERFEETGEGPYVLRFLDDFLLAGGGNYIDMFNFHYYPNFEARWAPHGKGVIGKTNYLVEKLASFGIQKPVVCTEIGIHSDASQGSSDEMQSRYVVQAFVRSMAADLRVVIWFALRDITEGFPYLYGLLDAEFDPKFAYLAFDTLTDELSGLKYQRTLTVAETGSSAVEGYVFANGSHVLYVAWSNDGASHPMAIGAAMVRRVTKYGIPELISDAADGIVDGLVGLEVGPSPIYVQLDP